MLTELNQPAPRLKLFPKTLGSCYCVVNILDVKAPLSNPSPLCSLCWCKAICSSPRSMIMPGENCCFSLLWQKIAREQAVGLIQVSSEIKKAQKTTSILWVNWCFPSTAIIIVAQSWTVIVRLHAVLNRSLQLYCDILHFHMPSLIQSSFSTVSTAVVSLSCPSLVFVGQNDIKYLRETSMIIPLSLLWEIGIGIRGCTGFELLNGSLILGRFN